MNTGRLNRICRFLTKSHLIPETLTWRLMFRKRLGRWPDLQHPHDINEKMMWLLRNTDTSLWTELADKYRVREYVAGKGLERLLVKNYGHYERVEDIDFNSLPNSFVIKSNNGFGTVMIVKDKSKLDIDKVRRTLNTWLKEDFGWWTGELHYTRIRPCIIIEELLEESEGKSLVDYKFWCMGGEVFGCFCCTDRDMVTHHANFNFYEVENWTRHEEWITASYKNDVEIPRPECLEEMISCAEKLSEGFPVVRVDLYQVGGKVYFGEMTFTSNACRIDFFTDELLNRMGAAVVLP